MIPAVYRNARYEFRIAQLAANQAELMHCIEELQKQCIALAIGLQSVSPMPLPDLPEIAGRAFGKGN